MGNRPVNFNDPTGHCFEPISGIICGIGVILIGAALIMSGSDQMNTATQQQGFQHEQQSLQNWQNNCMGRCHYSDHVPNIPNSTVGGPRPSTPNVDRYSRGMADVVVGTMMVADGTIGLISSGAAATRPVTVRHYTDNFGESAISNSRNLRPGSFVTTPSEVSPSNGHLQIEKLLEIKSGRGSAYMDFEVPYYKLRIPGNGPYTSGGAWQRQLIGNTRINAMRWRRPPGRPPLD